MLLLLHIHTAIATLTIETIADLQTRVVKLEEQNKKMKSENFEMECQLLKLISDTKAYVIRKIKETAYHKLGMPRTAIMLIHCFISS